MRTLVIGCGFLGAYFTNQYLRNQLNQLIIADTRPKSDIFNHPLLMTQLKGLRENQLTYYQVNSGDPWKLYAEFEKGIDNIVYTAAIANVGFAIANPKLTFDTNDRQLLDFLEFLRAIDFQGRFV